MSKKIVIKADLVSKACMSDILSVAAKFQGIKSMDIDAEKCTLTVVGTVDPVCIAQKLKKKCFPVTIISVTEDKKPEPAKPKTEPKKDPCKELCEKACKEWSDKLCCCKECKERHEKACKERCERRCKAWVDGSSCYCSRCRPSPGFCHTPSDPYCRCGRGCGGRWPGHFGC
ncbi:unnamed protein product [Urochloa humidicola]